MKTAPPLPSPKPVMTFALMMGEKQTHLSNNERLPLWEDIGEKMQPLKATKI